MPLTSATQQPVNDLNAIYQFNIRQRFKSEINRLTGGDMLELLSDRPLANELSFPLSYLHAFHWLRHNVHEDYREAVLSAFSRGRQAFLMQMLLHSVDSESFIASYINYWLSYTGEPQIQQRQLLMLYQHKQQDAAQLRQFMLDQWHSLGLFTQKPAESYHLLAQQEKQRYQEFSADEEAERLRLIDELPDIGPLPESFEKLGLIPSMACPQTCRHCMFIWRPIMKNTPDPTELYRSVNRLSNNVLFTGGDLTKQLDDFYRAIASMKDVNTFAILLNGDFAHSLEATESVLSSMARTIRKRPANWPDARVILQISFDEFHQEVIIDKQGKPKERIAISNIANIVQLAPRYAREIQLALLHKQHALNFSMDLFQKGVFARLAKELGSRGHQLQVLSTQASSRMKPNPAQGGAKGQLIKDANFILTQFPDVPIILTSSTIDAYGRATTIEKHEAVNDREMLLQLLDGQRPEGEYFDTDLMFWFNGWVTLFSAVHMNLGDFYRDGLETILRRYQKDPLAKALHEFDLRLLDYYAEAKDDLSELINNATGPHQLFHRITEQADMRLYLTRRLIEQNETNS
jgi:hypothetical protein